MRQIVAISKGENYTCISTSKYENIRMFSYLHPKLNMEVKGKVFTSKAMESTGCEISLQYVESR